MDDNVVRVRSEDDEWLELTQLDLTAYAMAKAITPNWDALSRKERARLVGNARMEIMARAKDPPPTSSI